MITNFKAKLIEKPRMKDKEGNSVEIGVFKTGQRYRIYTVYSEQSFTDFLVADDDGIFRWINMAAFRE